MQTPTIGLSCSYEKNEEFDRIFLNHDYLNAVRHVGGVPLILPTEAPKEELQYLLSLCDGLLLSGGNDINPALYGQEPQSVLTLAGCRDQGEIDILDAATQRKLPILGICRGIQLLNVYFGGTLIQDIPTFLPESAIRHSMEAPYHRVCHTVNVLPDTPLAALTGKSVISVNSHHHQAVGRVASCLAPMAYAEDGIPEALYKPDERFLWGVQWHPERIWDIEDSSAQIFTAFIAACQK